MLFASPEVLWLLVGLPAAVLLLLVAAARRRRALEAFAGRLHPRLAAVSRGRRAVKAGLLLAALILTSVALARPRFGTRIEEVPMRGLDLVVALDLSTSMLAEDVPPSRLAVARSEIAALIDRLQGDRVAILGFAGVPFVACPLTTDYGAAKMFLEALAPEVLPVPGTAIGPAIEKSVGAFASGEHRYKVLILVTDGEDHSGRAVAAAQEAARQGVRIYTIGIGQRRGGPIPVRGASGVVDGFKKDQKGSIVTSRLDVETLARVAEVTGGRSYAATRGEEELSAILAEISRMERRELGVRRIDRMEERYQFFAGLALLCLLVRGLVASRPSARQDWEGRVA